MTTDDSTTQTRITQYLSKKGKGIRFTTEEYVAAAKLINGDAYTYEKTIYKTADEKVIVTCPVHGDFEVRATLHLSKKARCKGCFPDMRGRSVKDNNYKKARFLKKATALHGDGYDYSALEYKGSNDATTFTCRSHGDFIQSPSGHLRVKHPCPECRNNAFGLTVDKFINKSTKVHGAKFDYSLVAFENCTDFAVIICPTHGAFEQSVSSHMQGTGCKQCHLDTLRLNSTEFIRRAKEIHGSKYDYEQTEYAGRDTKVEILCHEHGAFEQSPTEHLKGAGCQICANAFRGGYSRSDFKRMCDKNNDGDAMLYVIRCQNRKERFYKIGITSNDLSTRFKSSLHMPYEYREIYTVTGEGGYIYDLETRLHALLKDKKHEPAITFRGYTECFSELTRPVEKLLRELTATDQLQLIA